MSRLAAVLPRRFSVLAALLGVGLALLLAFSGETPVGRVEGRVVMAESGKPLAGVRIVLARDENAVEDFSGSSDNSTDRDIVVRRAVTDKNGRFVLARVPVGFYKASASTHAHSVEDQALSVDESETSDIELSLKRSLPELEMVQQQRVFTPDEAAWVPVRGYVDGARPRGRDTLHVRVFKARLSTVLNNPDAGSALQRVGQRYEPLPGLPAALLHPKSGASPQLLGARDVRITEGDGEGFFHQRIALDHAGPGLYLLDVRHGSDAVCAWVQVTDTGLVVKKARRQILTYSVDMKSGRPRAGSVVRLYQSGRLVAQKPSDGRGLATLSLPGSQSEEGGESESLMVVAANGLNEDAVSRLDYGEEEGGAYSVGAYTDRPIYRPGQLVQYKGIVRRDRQDAPDGGKWEGGARYDVSRGQPVTVQLRDSEGERVFDEKRVTNDYGSFHGAIELSPEAPSGVYTLVTSIAGEEHTHDIMVASYKKPEFAVTVTPERKHSIAGEDVEMIVSAQFYFGAPVVGAKIKWDVSREVDWSAEYPSDYGRDEFDEESNAEGDSEGHHADFDDEEGGAYGESVAHGEATLDETGKALVHFATEAPNDPEAPQAQLFSMHVSVTDASGREVESDGQAQVTAGDFRLWVSPEGYLAKPGNPSPITLEARDYNDHPVANTPVELESGYWKWDEDKNKSSFESTGFRRAVTGTDGKVTVSITPPHEGDFMLRATATDAGGHTIRGRASLWAASDMGGDFPTEYDDLSILTDKRRYRPGETARVLLNAKTVGPTALLTVEGSAIYRTIAVPLRRHSTVVQVPILAGYGPNVFLAACYVSNKKCAQSEVPLRVAVPQREVTIKVQPDHFKHAPGEPIAYDVQTLGTDGQPLPCELSFGVVDESIYALREDDPTVLRESFYPRRNNAVSTNFSFEAEYLGDADKAEPKIVTRKKFPDTAFWNPTLRTDAQGRAKVSFALPDNLTTWRATAIAQTLDTALGYATKPVLVTKDFFVRLEKPRFLTGNDESRVMALVHNGTLQEQTATVRLNAPALQVSGDATQSITVAPGQEGVVTWRVQARQMGDAKIKVTAWTPSGTSQLTDGVEETLAVRPHGREIVSGWTGDLSATSPGAPFVQPVNLDPAAAPGATRLSIRLSPSIFGTFWDALDELVGYPYGCTEQTLSRFLPDIMVQRLLRLSKGALDIKNNARYASLRAALPHMARDGILRLRRFQHEDGGWGWWETDADDAWMTAYVLYGLSIAHGEGYDVGETTLQRGRQAGFKLLGKAKGRDKTFLMYALALAGGGEAIRPLRAKMSLDGLGAQSLAHIVLLDKLLGNDTRVSWGRLEAAARPGGNALHWTAGTPDGNDLWDERTATAMGLRAMLTVNARDARAGSVLRWLMLQRQGAAWGDTLDTCLVLAALCDYLQSQPGAANVGGNVSVSCNGHRLTTTSLTPALLSEPDIVLRVPATFLHAGRNDLVFERTGSRSPVFYALELHQTMLTEDLAALSPGKLNVQREFRRVLPPKPNNPWQLPTEPTKNQLRQGDRIRVRLTINVPRTLSYVLIEDAFPAGCEVTERGMADESQDDWKFWWSSVDVRDDRIAFFARSIPPGKHVIEYNLRAQTPGSYHVLPTLLQEMYDPATKAESSETRVDVE